MPGSASGGHFICAERMQEQMQAYGNPSLYMLTANRELMRDITFFDTLHIVTFDKCDSMEYTENGVIRTIIRKNRTGPIQLRNSCQGLASEENQKRIKQMR